MLQAAQQQAYPDLVPYLSSLPPDTLLAQATMVARAAGWEIVAVDPQQGRLEATDTSLLFGFTDDMVIRILPQERGSQLDIRSMSRVGRSDVGVNAHRIRRFLNFSEAGARAVGLEPQQHQLLLAIRGLPAGQTPTVGRLAERLQVRLCQGWQQAEQHEPAESLRDSRRRHG